jgi:hypothetical protein
MKQMNKSTFTINPQRLFTIVRHKIDKNLVLLPLLLSVQFTWWLTAKTEADDENISIWISLIYDACKIHSCMHEMIEIDMKRNKKSGRRRKSVEKVAQNLHIMSKRCSFIYFFGC